jgi:F-type H+-transporting ATPase subunit b
MARLVIGRYVMFRGFDLVRYALVAAFVCFASTPFIARAQDDAAKAPEAAAEQPKADGEAPTAEAGKAEAEKVEAKADAAEHKSDAGHDDHGHDDAHAGGSHHDTTDLSHANATAGLLSPAEMRFQLAVASAVIFGLVLAILGKFAWGPIASGLDAREASIANMIAEAKRNQEETAAQLKLYEGKLQRAADEAREVVNQARREAEGVASKIVSEAQTQATAEKDRAVAEIRSAKNAALSEIAQRSVNTAVSLAGNLIRREVRPEDHEAMIQESLNQFRQN